MPKITPFGSNILVRPAQKAEILVSDQGTLCEYGEVIAIGDEVKKVSVGQKIGFLVWGVNKLDYEGHISYFIPENSDFILGFIE